MVLVIVCAQLMLLLYAMGTEPKIAYTRPLHDHVATAEDGHGSAVTVTVTPEKKVVGTEAETTPLMGRRYAEKDSLKSMSARAELYGIQFYAPPVIQGPAADPDTDTRDAFGRPVPLQRHLQSSPLAATRHHHSHHRLHNRPLQQLWEPTTDVVQQQQQQQQQQQTTVGAGDNPVLMNPLFATYGDPSTVRYPPAAVRSRPVARLVKYSEPTTLAFQLPFLAAEADDGALLENLPALQLALQHAASTRKLQPTSAGTVPSAAPLHLPYQQLHHHRLVAGYHQPHHHHHQQQQKQYHYPPLQHGHHLHHHRYATPSRYTQVPFLYNVPAPPPLQAQRHPMPAEYDLVTRFNRLLKEREREDLQKGAAVATAAAPEQDPPEEELQAEVAAEDEEEETTTRPVPTKKPGKKKRKRKRRPRPSTPEPAPVVEEDEEDDRSQQYDERSLHGEQEQSEEQESQNVADHEKMPAETTVHESEADYQNQNALDGPSEISEHFGGDLTFDDSDGERVEFQLHGLGGPDSYKFGFDTGKGTNRQFRYEERDNGGYVRGHYGYLDQDGKMQVYNYSSHPELGFQSQKTEARDT